MSRLDVHRAEIRHDDGTTVERIVVGSGEPWHLPPLDLPEPTKPMHFGSTFCEPARRASMDPALPYSPADWREVQAMRVRRVGLLVGVVVFVGCVLAGYLIA